MAYPELDREAARRDPTVLDRWQERMDVLYRAELSSVSLTFNPRDDTGRDGTLREWELAASRDREWAEGYRRGLADASISDDALRKGPGVMANDLKDGWTPSLERLSGYEDGMKDGGERRSP